MSDGHKPEMKKYKAFINHHNKPMRETSYVFWCCKLLGTITLSDVQMLGDSLRGHQGNSPFVWGPECTEAFDASRKKLPVHPYSSIMTQQ